MVADINLSDVEDGQIEIASEVIANKDVLTTVAAEGLGYPYPFTYTSKHLFKIGVLSIQIPGQSEKSVA